MSILNENPNPLMKTHSAEALSHMSFRELRYICKNSQLLEQGTISKLFEASAPGRVGGYDKLGMSSIRPSRPIM